MLWYAADRDCFVVDAGVLWRFVDLLGVDGDVRLHGAWVLGLGGDCYCVVVVFMLPDWLWVFCLACAGDLDCCFLVGGWLYLVCRFRFG